MRRFYGATLLLPLLLTANLAAPPAAPHRDARLAQLTGKGADWQQWDGFLNARRHRPPPSWPPVPVT
jgi:hypothetical protein